MYETCEEFTKGVSRPSDRHRFAGGSERAGKASDLNLISPKGVSTHSRPAIDRLNRPHGLDEIHLIGSTAADRSTMFERQ
jgi:hypothetical protein